MPGRRAPRSSGPFIAAPVIESLEGRRLLSASVRDGVLLVEGTDAGESIIVRANVEPDGSVRGFTVNVGSDQTGIPADGVRQVLIRAGGGADIVTVVVGAVGTDGGGGFAGPVRVEAGDGNDGVSADAPAGAVVFGGAGDDNLHGGRGDDTIWGGPGDDRLEGDRGNDLLAGEDGSDEIRGEAGDDRLSGGNGDDRMNGGDGADALSGGAGNDTLGILTTPTAPDGYPRYFELGDDSLDGGPGNDDLTGDDGNDRVQGGPGNDRVRGDDGRDELWGGAGNDDVDGGPGAADRVRGGRGRDEFIDTDARSERLDFGPGDARLRRLAPAEKLASVVGGVLLIRGTDLAEVITVTQTLQPQVTNPPVGPQAVAAFNYTVRVGDRVVESGSMPSDGINVIAVEAGGGDDVVDLATRTIDLAEQRGVTAVTLPAVLLGQGGLDTLYGGEGDDRINGGEGHDQVVGGGGNDFIGRIAIGPYGSSLPGGALIFEEPGDDSLAGGNGNDFVDGGDGNDRVGGNDGDDDLYGGPGNDRLGSAGGGPVTEEPGADRLFGGDGDDVLLGGFGTDEIRGEAGLDTFFDTDSPAEQLDRQPDEPLEQPPFVPPN